MIDHLCCVLKMKTFGNIHPRISYIGFNQKYNPMSPIGVLFNADSRDLIKLLRYVWVLVVQSNYQGLRWLEFRWIWMKMKWWLFFISVWGGKCILLWIYLIIILPFFSVKRKWMICLSVANYFLFYLKRPLFKNGNYIRSKAL
jgi:hypothetical protein